MKYEKPKWELLEFETDDIIRTSGLNSTVGDNYEDDWSPTGP